MSVFDELVGQRAVRAQLEKAAAAARALAGNAAAGAYRKTTPQNSHHPTRGRMAC